MKGNDHYLLLGSRHDRLSEPTSFLADQDWAAIFLQKHACPGFYSRGPACSRLRREWFDNGNRLNVVVSSVGRGFSRTLDTPPFEVMHEDAVRVFGPYMEGILWEPILCQSTNGPTAINYSVRIVPPQVEVDFGRGKVKIRPHVCKECGLAQTVSPNCSEMGVLRWQSRGRPVIASHTNSVAVLPEFFHDMKLKERFPDIKIVHKLKIYDSDPRGWVLPGDPEWDGKLRTPPNWRDLPRGQTPKQKAEWDAAIARAADTLRRALGE